MRVLLAGGGSAGHIEPALALADALRRIDSGVEVTCLGTERGLETRLIPLRGYPLELIPAVPMPRTVTPKLLTVPGRLAGAINAAAAALDRTRAQVLVGFGGYVATPAYLAARRRKVPIVVHEANPQAGTGQPARRQVHHARLHRPPGHPAEERQVPRHPDPARDRRPRPAGASATRPARTSASAPTCPCCSSPAARRGRGR